MAKSYNQITQTHSATNGLKRCYIKDSTGQKRLWLLNDAEIKARRAKGVAIEVQF